MLCVAIVADNKIKQFFIKLRLLYQQHSELTTSGMRKCMSEIFARHSEI